MNINEVVDNSIQTFTLNLENKGFLLNTELHPNLPSVMADKEAIAEAFINLVDNAIKYSHERKEINIRTGLVQNAVFIQVEDRGIGISPKDQKYIFDKFYRVSEKNLANKVKGSGLGLAIVKHIMDAHKGKAEVESIPGSGSVFRLTIPFSKN
ncbi:MAG: HAMP domain-containing histidine kinase [Bacteroidales bacterium]|nr:HAMP domain-containing histidine kinase [Bacteroidales bacterium]